MPTEAEIQQGLKNLQERNKISFGIEYDKEDTKFRKPVLWMWGSFGACKATFDPAYGEILEIERVNPENVAEVGGGQTPAGEFQPANVYIHYHEYDLAHEHPTLVIQGDVSSAGYAFDKETVKTRRICLCNAYEESECSCGAW